MIHIVYISIAAKDELFIHVKHFYDLFLMFTEVWIQITAANTAANTGEWRTSPVAIGIALVRGRRRSLGPPCDVTPHFAFGATGKAKSLLFAKIRLFLAE